MCERLSLGPDSLVVELASNDGYLLQHFLPKGIPVLGIEPALNVAEAAVARGVETITEFFGAELGARLARERGHADLVLGNNVLAQVPDINDFAAGVAALLAPGRNRDLRVPAPREARRAPRVRHDLPRALLVLLAPLDPLDLRRAGSRPRRRPGAREPRRLAAGLPPSRGGRRRPRRRSPSARARGRAGSSRPGLVHALRRGRARVEASAPRAPDRSAARGQQVVGYGAPGEGEHPSELLRDPHGLPRLHGRPEPVQAGQAHARDHIPIHPPEKIAETRPDVIVILPWNLAREITEQLAYTAEWGARLVVRSRSPGTSTTRRGLTLPSSQPYS